MHFNLLLSKAEHLVNPRDDLWSYSPVWISSMEHDASLLDAEVSPEPLVRLVD